jgi:hypothetical protein
MSKQPPPPPAFEPQHFFLPPGQKTHIKAPTTITAAPEAPTITAHLLAHHAPSFGEEGASVVPFVGAAVVNGVGLGVGGFTST